MELMLELWREIETPERKNTKDMDMLRAENA